MHLRYTVVFIMITLGSACGGSRVSDGAALSDVQLADVRDDIKLFTKLDNQDANNLDVKKDVAESIVKNTMLVRSLEPEIGELGGESLETLCLLSQEKGRSIIGLSGDKELVKRVNEYLGTVHPFVVQDISNMQKDTKRGGVAISRAVSWQCACNRYLASHPTQWDEWTGK